jgi:hypothetical protein
MAPGPMRLKRALSISEQESTNECLGSEADLVSSPARMIICFGSRIGSSYFRRNDFPLPVIPRISVWATSPLCNENATRKSRPFLTLSLRAWTRCSYGRLLSARTDDIRAAMEVQNCCFAASVVRSAPPSMHTAHLRFLVGHAGSLAV